MSTWTIDKAHTDISFSARHMMVTTVRGKFREVEGTIELDEGAPMLSRAEIRVSAASIDTGFDARDQHLRSADFFDADNFAWIVIRTTGIEPSGDDRYTVTADVTIRGITRPVTFDVVSLGFYTGMDGSRRVGFSAAVKISRKDWDLSWNVALETGGWLVGDQVKLEIDIAAEQTPTTARVAA
jgi:polyisoprenoid-binding protein YceI